MHSFLKGTSIDPHGGNGQNRKDTELSVEKLLHAYRGNQNRWDESYNGKVTDTGR